MNAASKLKWANELTNLAAIFVSLQALLTTPPFSSQTVIILTAVLTYLTMVATYAKQWLSPEVSDTGTKVTFWIFVTATVAGIGDLLHLFPFITPQWALNLKLIISAIVMIINIRSKQMFKSDSQIKRLQDLKKK